MNTLDKYEKDKIYKTLYKSMYDDVMRELNWKCIFYTSIALERVNEYGLDRDVYKFYKIPSIYRYQYMIKTTLYRFTKPINNEINENFIKYGNKGLDDAIELIKYKGIKEELEKSYPEAR